MASKAGGGRSRGRGKSRDGAEKKEEVRFENVEYLESEEEEKDPFYTDDDVEKDADYVQPDEKSGAAPSKRMKTSTPKVVRKRKTKSISKDEKEKFAKILKKEEVIYNLNCVLKSNFLFLFVVLECKTLYKSIRDAARYRQKKAAGKSGDSGDEALNDDSENTSSEVSDSFAFLLPTSSKFPRKTLTFGGSIHGTSDDKSIDSGRAIISPNSSRNDDMYTDEELKKVIADEEKYNAFIDENELSKAMTHYVSNQKNPSSTVTSSESSLKFDYIWRNLDQLFQQMTKEQVNDLNFKFIGLAFAKLQEKSKTEQQNA